MAELTTAEVWRALEKSSVAVLGHVTAAGAPRILEISPQGQFLTYGIGVPPLTMRDPTAARARLPVS